MYESDGRTDGHRMTVKPRLMPASRGKNRRIAQEHRLNLSEFKGNYKCIWATWQHVHSLEMRRWWRWKCGSGKCRSDKVSKAIRRKYSKVWLSWLSCVLVAKRNSQANRPVNIATEHWFVCKFLGHLQHITIDSVSDVIRVTRGLAIGCAKKWCVSRHRVIHASRWCRAVINASVSRVPTKCTTKDAAVLFAARLSTCCCVCTNFWLTRELVFENNITRNSNKK